MENSANKTEFTPKFLKGHLPEAFAIANQHTAFIILVRGKLGNGNGHYAYVLMNLSQFVRYKRAEQMGNFNVSDYGKVLQHGEGNEPPLQIQREMEHTYCASMDLAKQLENITAAFVEDLQKISGSVEG